MSRSPAAERTSVPSAAALALDLVAVAVFVLIGRASHDESRFLGALTTFWPFAVGVLIGWLVSLLTGRMPGHPSGGRTGTPRPLSITRAGVPVWISAVVVGLALRALMDQGVQTSFAIVTTIVLAVFLLGWRLVAMSVARRAERRGSRRAG
jgi:hypothetical protein